MKKVTIQDIADELGVSRNTVSKAINNADGLAEATRERILQKAIEMGYKQFSYIKEQTRVSPEQEAPGKGEIALLIGDAIDGAHFAAGQAEKGAFPVGLYPDHPPGGAGKLPLPHAALHFQRQTGAGRHLHRDVRPGL